MTVRKITNQKPYTNKMIIFKSFFNHAGGHSEQDIIQVLRQCGFVPPDLERWRESKLYGDFSAKVKALWRRQCRDGDGAVDVTADAFWATADEAEMVRFEEALGALSEWVDVEKDKKMKSELFELREVFLLRRKFRLHLASARLTHQT